MGHMNTNDMDDHRKESCMNERFSEFMHGCFQHYHSSNHLPRRPQFTAIDHWIADPQSARGYLKVEQSTIIDGTRYCIRAPDAEDLAVEKIDRNFICCICYNVLEEAVVVVPCAHVFGLPCIRRLFSNAKSLGLPITCPIDSGRIKEELVPARFAREMIPTIMVRCPFGMSFDLASNAYVPLETVIEDIRDPAVSENQTFFCTEVMEYAMLEQHVWSCAFRSTRCVERDHGCDAITPQTGLIARMHASVCPGRILDPCLGCGETIRASDWEAHKKVCVGEIVSCQNSDIGCLEECARGDLPAHAAMCPYSNHLVNADLRRLYKVIEDLTRKVGDLETSVKDLESTRDALSMQLDEEMAHRLQRELSMEDLSAAGQAPSGGSKRTS